jgi:hypothetical protein
MKRVLAENCLPIFTSDGLKMYFYALTAHFGYWCPQEGRRKQVWIVATGFLYGQVIKRYRRKRTVGIEYRMQWGRFENLKTRLKALGLSGKLNTAYVERANLTLRQGIAPLIRRTWGTAQTHDGLRLYLEWWRGYYHFIRPHMSLREELSQPIARKADSQTLSGANTGGNSRNHPPSLDGERVSQLSVAGGARLAHG